MARLKDFTRTGITGKGKIVARLRKETKLPEEQISFMYDALFAAIKDELEKCNPVSLPGIGTFWFRSVAPRVSNLTGTVVKSHKRLLFKKNFVLARKIRLVSRDA